MSAVEVLEGESVEVPTNALTVHEDKSAALWEIGALTDEEFERRKTMLKSAVARVADLQRSLLDEGTDWGSVPGVPRPFLHKPGAEKLAAFYKLVPEFHSSLEVAEDMPNGLPDRLTYTTRCLLHYGSHEGPVVGEGVGVCSSWERRYLYRKSELKCPTCGKQTIIKGKAEFGGGWLCWKKKGGCNAKFGDNDQRITTQGVGEVVNTEPWDGANTYAKMSEKRAHVDAVIRTLGVSGLFTQDDDSPQVRKPASDDPGEEPNWDSMEPYGPPPETPMNTIASAPRASRAAPPTKSAGPAPEPAVEGEYRETFDDAPLRAEGVRGKPSGTVQGSVKALVREETAAGNAYWHLTLLGDDLKLYECAVPMDTAIETGVVADAAELESPYADGRTLAVMGNWTKRPDGMWLVLDGLVA